MSHERNTAIAIAWFRPQDWARLREISADRDNLEDTHAQWVVSANKVLRQIEDSGQPCERILVDLDDLLAWCRARDLPVNGTARAEFVSEKLAEKPRPQN